MPCSDCIGLTEFKWNDSEINQIRRVIQLELGLNESTLLLADRFLKMLLCTLLHESMQWHYILSLSLGLCYIKCFFFLLFSIYLFGFYLVVCYSGDTFPV